MPRTAPRYERIVYRVYGGLSRAGHQVALWHAEQLLDRDPAEFVLELPVLVAPGLVLVGDELASWLRAYAEAGGHLVLGIRTATSDDEGRVRADVAAGRIRGCGRRLLRRVQQLCSSRSGDRLGRYARSSWSRD